MPAAAIDGHTALFHAPVIKVVEINHLANFGEAEADVLGPHDPSEACAVTLGINPRQTYPPWGNEPFILVESECSCRAVKFSREVGYAELFSQQTVRTIQMSASMP